MTSSLDMAQLTPSGVFGTGSGVGRPGETLNVNTVGEGFLFPGNRDPSQALHKLMAGYYLTRAEDLAGLPHQKRGGWHAFRRGWATRRKHLPVQDVMAQGGWRDVKALQTAYQGADAKTRLMVAESA